MFFVPDPKDPVNQKSSKEAEDDVGPGVPGIQLHEVCRVQVQILVQSGNKMHQVLVGHLGSFGFKFHH